MTKNIVDEYQEFIKSKALTSMPCGFDLATEEISADLFDFQRSICHWALKKGRASIFADTGLGKQQPITEPVLTPAGWRAIGDLIIGDSVIGSNGKPTRVLGVFPQGVKRVFRLELSDGTFVRAGEEHLWKVRTKTQRYRGQDFVVMTTSQIADSIHRDWQLPLIAPIESDPIELPIDPYALGVMLGDGSSKNMTYICTDNWIGSYLGWRKTSQHECEYVGYWAGPVEILRELELFSLRGVSSDTKFVPQEYLIASPSQRLELLHGLMDTDGYPMPDGGAEFSSSSRQLVDAVCDLVRSLGGVARGYRECASTFTYEGEKRKGKQAWRVNVKLPSNVPMFKLPRKAENYLSPSKYPPARIIRNVVDEGVDEPQVCIKVEAADSLYVTRDYILTHNTGMQLVWAQHVCNHTDGNVLILAPLCVAHQTVREGEKFNVSVNYCRSQDGIKPGVNITNYEMLDKFDLAQFAGVVLDESSILKNQNGATRNAIIEACQPVPYRLSCTATPSPNDFMELGNQVEFLGIMTMQEMLAMFFTHDGGETSSWILKGHGRTRFWEWMATWAVCIRNPADLGFDGSRYVLPALNIISHVVESDPVDDLFAKPVVGMLERNQARKESIDARVSKIAEIINASSEQWVVWCHRNEESEKLASLIIGAKDIKGPDSDDSKEKNAADFLSGELRVLVCKPSVFGFGMNWQHCNHTAFVGLSDSWEQYYQAIRRFWRFGQTKEVYCHVVSAESEGAVVENIKRKDAQNIEMSEQMVAHMRVMMEREIFGSAIEKTEYTRDIVKTENYELHLADCVDLASEIASDSIDYTIFSPPFASLYTYSNSDRDMGNCKSHGEFYEHFQFLVKQMFRITKPGRLLSFHCMNLPTSKVNDGFIGIRDFRGELIRMFVELGWIYHSEVCIWKDPVTAMQRTKALGLLHKTIRKDSAMSRQGIPDYLVTMRKPGDNPKPIAHTHEEFPVSLWQRYASPVWFDINPSKTLNGRNAREDDDQRHIAPLQLEVIERALELWTAPDDLVFSPFTGIGSEGWCALQAGRRFIGSELKPAYFRQATINLADATKRTDDLFSDEAAA